jgi:hypothetical protein
LTPVFIGFIIWLSARIDAESKTIGDVADIIKAAHEVALAGGQLSVEEDVRRRSTAYTVLTGG